MCTVTQAPIPAGVSSASTLSGILGVPRQAPLHASGHGRSPRPVARAATQPVPWPLPDNLAQRQSRPPPALRLARARDPAHAIAHPPHDAPRRTVAHNRTIRRTLVFTPKFIRQSTRSGRSRGYTTTQAPVREGMPCRSRLSQRDPDADFEHHVQHDSGSSLQERVPPSAS